MIQSRRIEIGNSEKHVASPTPIELYNIHTGEDQIDVLDKMSAYGDRHINQLIV